MCGIDERTLDALRLFWSQLRVRIDDGVRVAATVEELRTELLSADTRTDSLFGTADRAQPHRHTRHHEHWHVPQRTVRPTVNALLVDLCGPLAINVPPLDGGRIEDLYRYRETVNTCFSNQAVGVAIE